MGKLIAEWSVQQTAQACEAYFLGKAGQIKKLSYITQLPEVHIYNPIKSRNKSNDVPAL